MRARPLSVVLPLGLLLAGCAARPPGLCPTDGGCAAGSTCLAGRCRTPEALPAGLDSTRVLLEPLDLAVVASGATGGGGDALPETVALGRASNGTVLVLMRFAATWRDDADVASAFLLVERVEGAAPALAPVTLETARILEAWSPSLVTWGRQPRLGLPEAAGTVLLRGVLRVDVTSLVRAWAKRDRDDHGLALLAEGKDPLGAAYSLGVSSGTGPRLEVYVR